MDTRPDTNEYNVYFSKYMNLVPDGDILDILEQQNEETSNLLDHLSEEQALYKYAPNKWSIKEIIGHLADTERILSYTLLCIARGDAISLPRNDKDLYVKNAQFDEQQLQDLLEQLSSVRKSSLQLLRPLKKEDWVKCGSALGSNITVRALAFILAGHELHHRKIIQELYIGSQDFALID